ncbi:MAG: cation diffusion facilitator family transporter [Caulobacteraceae bacterium]
MTDRDPAAPAAMRLTGSQSARLTARVTWLSVSVGLSLMLLKSGVWWASGSISLLASAADSGLDFVAALATFWAVRLAVRPADSLHRYGHGKAEAFASLLQAGLVFASAALIGREAITHLIRPVAIRNEGPATFVMLVSVAATLALVQAQSWVIRRTRSVAISGDRAHYLADLVSNLAAILGLGLARLTGDARWDAAAGVIVAVWLVWGAVGVLRVASNELMDREVDEADRQEILRLAKADVNVLGVHQFRTRASGPFLHVQMHMELQPDQSLHEAHEIVEAAENRILAAYPATDLVIHADPYGLSEDHDVEFDSQVAPYGTRTF